MSTGTTYFPISRALQGNGLPLILALVAAVLVAQLALAYWSFALLCGVVVFLLSAARSEALLLSIVFLIPIGWITEIGLPTGGVAGRLDVATTVRLLVVGGFLAGQLFWDWRSVITSLKAPLAKLSLLFAGATCASLILGGNEASYSATKAVVRLLSYIGFCLVLVLWVNSKDLLRKITFTIMASTIFVAAFGIFQEVIGEYTSFWFFLNPPTDFFEEMDHRAPSFFANCNSLAGYLNLVLPFSIACWILGEGRWKRLGAWSTVLSVVSLLCTQSLGGVVSFGAIVILGIFCFVKGRKKKLALLAAVAVLAAGFYFAIGSLSPVHEGEALAYDQSIRLILWGIAGNLFTHSPLIGVGWGNFTELYGSYVEGISWIPEGRFAVHNLYLQLLAETGLVGFGAFFLLIFRAVQQALRQWRLAIEPLDKALGFGVLGAILAVLLHGSVDFLFHVSPQFGTLFWVLLALLVVSGKRLRETSLVL